MMNKSLKERTLEDRVIGPAEGSTAHTNDFDTATPEFDESAIHQWNDFEQKLLRRSPQTRPSNRHTTPRLWFDPHRAQPGDRSISPHSDAEISIIQRSLKSCRKSSVDTKMQLATKNVSRSRTQELSKLRSQKA